MRASINGEYLRLRAIAGTHVVVLAWDFAKPPNLADFTDDNNLLGFAIHRKKFNTSGQIETSYYLRGIKRFESKDKGLPRERWCRPASILFRAFCGQTTRLRPAWNTNTRLAPSSASPRSSGSTKPRGFGPRSLRNDRSTSRERLPA